MDTEELKSAIDKAQEAVKDVKDESLKKIAFQKVLDTLLTPQPTPRTLPPLPLNQTPLEIMPSSRVNNDALRESIAEFIHGKNQKSHFNIVLAMAFYLHFKTGEDFCIDDIRKGYKSCLIPEPKNITDIINQNIRKGLIVKSDKLKEGKQTYHVTKNGIDYVNSDFTLKLKSSFPRHNKSKSVENEENAPEAIRE